MNYLARIFLNCETVFLQGIRDPYDWHQRAWDAFPHLAQCSKGGDSQFRHFLTRLDPQEDGFRLLILSRSEPRRPDWCPADPVNWQIKPVPESLLQHARYRFGLRANPTKKVTPKGEDGRRRGQGKRVALRTLACLEDWMLRKAAAAGFAIEPGSLRIIAGGLAQFSQPRAPQRGTINIADFGGTLRVLDRAAFEAAFAHGIGSAKAFGCGMLLLQSLD